jgi:hypothetical protein
MISDLQRVEDAWLGIEVDESTLFNPMDFVFEDGDKDQSLSRLAYLMMKPEYFSWSCKYIFNIQLSPFQALLLKEIWDGKFPMVVGSRGMGKSFILSLYVMLRAFYMPRRKIIIVGAAFRQSKVLFEYMDTIWKNAPVLRDLCDSKSGPRRDVDRCVMHIGQSTITCLPLGDGSKIRGQRANDIVADEFASIPRDIFENVVAGFAAVASSPIEKVREKAEAKRSKELGIPVQKTSKESIDKSNQIILSGTAYYAFNHFSEYWKRYKAIVKSGGNIRQLEEVFGGTIPKDFDWTQYSVTRIPVELLADGFMDAGQIGRAKATIHAGIYQMEYGAIFTTDSQGFFKRSLVESCTTHPTKTISFPFSGDVCFEASLTGDSNKHYVLGVDPASEVDNFSIVVMEVNKDHRKVVHCWTTNRKSHKEKLKSKMVDEDDFYSYCAKKIRQLMTVFPCLEVAMDAQGGGIAVMEALHDKDKIPEGELPIWPVIDEDKAKDTDDNVGLHVLRMCQFAKYDWLAEANHGLRKDFEDKVVLFPYFDTVSLGIALEVDKSIGRKYDTLEDCVMEIEDLKDELSIIEMTQTTSGRERWDTPEVKTGPGRKNRLRKDRYSSLIMANMSARSVLTERTTLESGALGGFANDSPSFGTPKDAPLFHGPSWFTEKTRNLY